MVLITAISPMYTSRMDIGLTDISVGAAAITGVADTIEALVEVDIRDGKVDTAGTAEALVGADIRDGEVDTAGTVEVLAGVDIMAGAVDMVGIEVIQR